MLAFSLRPSSCLFIYLYFYNTLLAYKKKYVMFGEFQVMNTERFSGWKFAIVFFFVYALDIVSQSKIFTNICEAITGLPFNGIHGINM